MPPSILPLTVPALQVAVADTVVTVVARSGLQVAAEAASVVLALVALAAAALLAAILLQLRSVIRSLGGLGRRVETRAEPLVDRARSTLENVEFITLAVRTDVKKLNQSVERISRRLNQASDRVEERIEELNALIEVVQSEAEDLFIDTASTVRGVRAAGARALGGPDGSRSARRAALPDSDPDRTPLDEE